LACVSQDAQGKETTVNIDINGEKFIAHGITVIQKNYLEVYIYEKWSDKQIANYEAIKEFQPTSINLVQGETEPPQLLTEADLISLMDKHGIGTDATHADHIETVKQREYIGVQGRDLYIGKNQKLVQNQNSKWKNFARAKLAFILNLVSIRNMT
jgi:DNA topoisomerase-3